MYTYALAKTETDRQQVAALVTRVYERSGYVAAASDTPITSYLHNVEQTSSIMALLGGVLVGTISIVRSGAVSLPLESLYHFEVAALSLATTSRAEICQFAVDKTLLPRKFGNTKLFEAELALQLLALVILLCKAKAITHGLFAINPKHKAFYESLGSKQIGAEKTYAAVNGAPALAYVLNFSDLKQGLGSGMVLRSVAKLEPVARELF